MAKSATPEAAVIEAEATNPAEIEVTEESFAAALATAAPDASIPMLQFLSSAAFGINSKALTLRAAIAAATQSKSERRAEVLNSKDNEEVAKGVAFIAELKATLADAEKNLNALVDTIVSESAGNEDLVKDKDTYRELVAKASDASGSLRTVLVASIGEGLTEQWFILNDFEPAGPLRRSNGSAHKSSGGAKRPRFAEVRVDGQRVENAKGTSNMTAAATFLKAKGDKDATAGGILAAFSTDDDVIDSLRTTPGEWEYTYALGEATHTVKITTDPVVSEDDSEENEDDSEA